MFAHHLVELRDAQMEGETLFLGVPVIPEELSMGIYRLSKNVPTSVSGHHPIH